MRLSPQTHRQLQRFRSLRRGWWSFLLLGVLAAAALLAELLVSNRALFVSYQGKWFFPSYGAIHTGREFGYGYD